MPPWPPAVATVADAPRARAVADPLKYVIFERYRRKDDYTGAHRRSPAFKEFRPQMRALQDSGKVTVTGSSFNELGIGFT